jgi:hypothetical protein
MGKENLRRPRKAKSGHVDKRRDQHGPFKLKWLRWMVPLLGTLALHGSVHIWLQF